MKRRILLSLLLVMIFQTGLSAGADAEFEGAGEIYDNTAASVETPEENTDDGETVYDDFVSDNGTDEADQIVFDDDFINRLEFVFETNNNISGNAMITESIGGENEIISDETDETLTTAPVVDNDVSLKIANDTVDGMRYLATASYEQRELAAEYGFLLCSSEALESSGMELSLELEQVQYVKGVAYNREENIDNYYQLLMDGGCIYSGIITGILSENYVDYITARSYIIYDVDGVRTTVYGNTVKASVYRKMKYYVNENLAGSRKELLESLIRSADDSADFSSARTADIMQTVTGNIGSDPDIDIIRFIPESSGFYTFNLTGEGTGADYNIFSADKTLIGKDENGSYYFDKANVYYAKIYGTAGNGYAMNSEFSQSLNNKARVGKVYNVVICDHLVAKSTTKTYILTYDPESFVLDDACGLTYTKETSTGTVTGTNINVTLISAGQVKFTFKNTLGNPVSGVINCIKLKCIKEADFSFSIT